MRRFPSKDEDISTKHSQYDPLFRHDTKVATRTKNDISANRGKSNSSSSSNYSELSALKVVLSPIVTNYKSVFTFYLPSITIRNKPTKKFYLKKQDYYNPKRSEKKKFKKPRYIND